MKKVIFFTHSVALSALFIMGRAVIGLPEKSADEFTFAGYIVAVGAGFLLYIAVIPIINKLFSAELLAMGSCKRIGFSLIFAAVAVFAAMVAADTFLSFTDFAGEVILPDTSAAITVLIFGAVAVYFARRRQEDMLKFCLLAFWFIIVMVVFFFFATMHNYDLRNIFVFRFPDAGKLYTQSKPYIKTVVLPSLLLPVYNALVFKKCRGSAAFTGFGTGVILLGVCVISPILLFGQHLAGTLDFPYASAVSTVTVGRLFTRMDGFSYFIYFAAALTQINTCVFIICSCLKKISEL